MRALTIAVNPMTLVACVRQCVAAPHTFNARELQKLEHRLRPHKFTHSYASALHYNFSEMQLIARKRVVRRRGFTDRDCFVVIGDPLQSGIDQV